MHVRPNLTLVEVFNESWRFAAAAAAWAALVVYLGAFRGWAFVSLPMIPVLTLAVAIAVYLGVRSAAAFSRWREAHAVWAEIVSTSRALGNDVCHLIHDEEGRVDHGTQRDLIRRHVAWVNALAFQLRPAKEPAPFRGEQAPSRECYLRHLEPEEIEAVEAAANPAAQILRLQGAEVRDLTLDGQLDSVRQTSMMALLNRLSDCQGRCERIATTPFPPQIGGLATVFTWILLVLVPPAFVDGFTGSAGPGMSAVMGPDARLFLLVPFATVFSWVFFILERAGSSTEVPFAGGVNGVPVSALSVAIETDLKQMVGMGDIPPPVQPVDGVLY